MNAGSQAVQQELHLLLMVPTQHLVHDHLFLVCIAVGMTVPTPDPTPSDQVATLHTIVPRTMPLTLVGLASCPTHSGW